MAFARSEGVDHPRNAAARHLGNGALVLLSNSTIFGNLTGLNALNGGQIVSFQNNRVGGNVSDNSPTGTLTQR